jgi:hypothetical protein
MSHLKVLFLQEGIHLFVACAIAFINYALTSSFFLTLLAFLICFFIDIDHLFDYFLYLRATGDKFNLISFLEGKYFALQRKVYLPFHAWEYVIIASILWYITGEPLFFVLFSALGAHYLVDQFTNMTLPLGYFILYRFKRSFVRKYITTLP